ncbi:transposase, IS605 OrfB family protein [Halobiforma nitratireducens JCM 10879]|uniref:Transposase, IS605 OrfB family protein n=1 Tax=Halobiforma nitratireducens JCM 10879 TaxID=1227454 RepID=M0MDY9_9EURY|nr:transposase, IS605 OrfB family protein [Halobiforma nitratireducens JCM 10879]
MEGTSIEEVSEQDTSKSCSCCGRKRDANRIERGLYVCDQCGMTVAGTQLGLSGSMQGLRELLGDLAAVTTDDATAVVDCYDPTFEGGRRDARVPRRSDARARLPRAPLRVRRYRRVHPAFRLFRPDRLREAAVGTGWRVAAVRRPHDAYYYRVALSKR